MKRHAILLAAICGTLLFAVRPAHAESVGATTHQTPSPAIIDELFTVVGGFGQSFTMNEGGDLARIELDATWTARTNGRTYEWRLLADTPNGNQLASGTWSLGGATGAGSGSGALSFDIAPSAAVTAGSTLVFVIRQLELSGTNESSLVWWVGDDPETWGPYLGGDSFTRSAMGSYSPGVAALDEDGDGTADVEVDFRLRAYLADGDPEPPSTCDLPLYDECIAPGTGSVFQVELIDADLHSCLLTCTIASATSAVTCDTQSITCAN